MSSFKENFEEKKEALKEDIEETKESIGKSFNSGVRKTKSFFKKVLIYTLIGVVVSGGVYLLWCNWTYSDGTRTGYLMKISTKGYVFKTYEGQLNLGGFQESDNTSIIGNIWDFSLTDKDLLKKLETLEGKKVMLRYKEINKAMPWQGDTNYYIYEAEER
jgi:hypothetical protein